MARKAFIIQRMQTYRNDDADLVLKVDRVLVEGVDCGGVAQPLGLFGLTVVEVERRHGDGRREGGGEARLVRGDAADRPHRRLHSPRRRR